MGWPREPEKVVPWAMDRVTQKHPLACLLWGLRGFLRASICGFDRIETEGNQRPSEAKIGRGRSGLCADGCLSFGCVETRASCR